MNKDNTTVNHFAPEDWHSLPLQSFCKEPVTYGIVQCGPHLPSGIPYIRVSDMAPRGLNVDTMLRTSNEIASRFPRSKVEEGDLVFALRGKIGEVVEVSSEVAGANLTQGTARISPSTRVDGSFLLWALRSPEAVKQAELEAKGTTFREITLSDLRNIVVTVPPTKAEQEAIAEALSDADDLIESLEKLIAKKRLVKQGAMQELLTGERRLPGFEGEWKCVRLEEGATFINGRAYGLAEWETYGTPVIRLQNLTGRGEEYYYSTLQLPEKQYCDEGDLLYMWSATMGPVFWKGPRAIYHYHIWKVECDVEFFDKIFLFHLLNEMTEQFKSESSSGAVMLHLTKESMEKTEVIVPPTVIEQTAIAEILTSIQQEVDSIESRLCKARQIKEGMMQQLLTGQIRLV